MHSLLYYELRTPSFDTEWAAQAQARADLAATRPERPRRLRLPAFARRPRPVSVPCPSPPCWD